MNERFDDFDKFENFLEKKGDNWYRDLFEKRFNNLKPYSSPKSLVKEFATDSVGIIPEKLTSAILWNNNDNFEILIRDCKESGYSMLDHYKILDEFNIAYKLTKTLSSIVMSSKNERYLMTNGLEYIKNDYKENIEKTLVKYRISTAYNLIPESGYWGDYYLDPFVENGINIDCKKYDDLIFDDWSSQVAEIYGLTVNEFLRFRLGQGLPDGRKPRIIK